MGAGGSTPGGCAAATTPRALCVGCSAYGSHSLGGAPVRDAAAVADALRGAGWDVTLLVEPHAAEVHDALAALQRSLQHGASALLFFAGHAGVWNNENYLILEGLFCARHNAHSGGLSPHSS